jgi:hypothetical protein
MLVLKPNYLKDNKYNKKNPTKGFVESLKKFSNETFE